MALLTLARKLRPDQLIISTRRLAKNGTNIGLSFTTRHTSSCQYLETIRRENHLDPEKMLMLAVLEDGVTCLQKYISTRDEKGKRLLSEAEEWILMEQNGDWLFSFDNICETLGLNPGYIREGLQRQRHHRLKERDQVRLGVNRSQRASRN